MFEKRKRLLWTIITLAGAVILDRIAGEPPIAIHPVAWMGKFITFLKNGAPAEGSKKQFVYGALIVLSGCALFAGLLLLVLCIKHPCRCLISIPLLKIIFSIKELFRTGALVKQALEENDDRRARKMVGPHLVSRDTSKLSIEGLIGATIESLAENMTDSISAIKKVFIKKKTLEENHEYYFKNNIEDSRSIKGSHEKS